MLALEWYIVGISENQSVAFKEIINDLKKECESGAITTMAQAEAWVAEQVSLHEEEHFRHQK